MEKIKEYLIFAALIVFFILAITMGIVPTKGPGYCREAVEEKTPSLLSEAVEIDSMFTRTLDNKWITSLVYQPKDLNLNEITVVCDFKSTNYVFKEIKTYDGNKLEKLKLISTSNYHPKTWLQ